MLAASEPTSLLRLVATRAHPLVTLIKSFSNYKTTGIKHETYCDASYLALSSL